MKRWLLFLALLMALSACQPTPPAPTETAPPPTVTLTPTETALPSTATPTLPRPSQTPDQFDIWNLWTQGTRLRGANIYQRRVYPGLDGDTFMGIRPMGPPYTQEDFIALAEAGANYVNISTAGLYPVQPPYVLDEEILAQLDELVAMAAQADLFVVLSVRSGPGRSEFSILRDGAGVWFDEDYLVESVWEDPAARAAWADMWREIAAHFGGSQIVVGYDLMVEPNANDILGIYDPEEFYATYGGSGYDWNSWYPDLVAAIRSVDSRTPILVGGLGYSAVPWLAYLKPVDDARMVYTVHQYAPFVYTHQEAESGLPNTYPGRFDADWDGSQDVVNRQWLAQYLSALDDFSARYNVPVAVNECGVMRWEPGAADFMRDQLDILEAQGRNYAVWMWYAYWPPLANPDGDHDFNFRLGPQPDNFDEQPNQLFDVYRAFWSRNQVRPFQFLP